ncbi:hypothetical protein [Amycolatopsis rifamycinica]|uniref:Secreted protein n=1 Tax=Amycolatopsis rifamycinica TaxID=287986 RepID=A0A066TWK4_9PSEU|nr:hypothetical protein [Amycolatopsis rifamycinica]KDN19200.1 hypothetical protein DV20_26445 [Amycolatopsis rifamycinica]
MRKAVQFIVTTGFLLTTLTSLPGVASAVEGAKPAQAECVQATDNTTFASVFCQNTDSRYRVVADYCRLNCTREYGPWKYNPFRSEVTFPPGGTIVNSWFEIE